MKKFITNIKTLAALLMAGAAFTACSSSDDNIIEQPKNPTEPQVYTMVIKASKGEQALACIGVSDDEGSCGTITIDGVTNATTSSTFEHFNSSVSGDTWTLRHK